MQIAAGENYHGYTNGPAPNQADYRNCGTLEDDVLSPIFGNLGLWSLGLFAFFGIRRRS